SGGKLAQRQEPQVISVPQMDNELAPWLQGGEAVGIGTGWGLLESKNLLAEVNVQFWPQAAAIAHLGLEAFEAGAYTDAMAAEPIYLRNEISWKKRQRIRG